MDRAQAQYDAQMPPDDGPEPEECEDCEGTGHTDLCAYCHKPTIKRETRILRQGKPFVIVSYHCENCADGQEVDVDDCETCGGEGVIIPEERCDEDRERDTD